MGPEQLNLFPDLIGDVDVREVGTHVVYVWKVTDEALEREVQVEVWKVGANVRSDPL